MADLDTSQVVVVMTGPEKTWIQQVEMVLRKTHGFTIVKLATFRRHEPDPHSNRWILSGVMTPSDLSFIHRRPDSEIVWFGGATNAQPPAANAANAAAGTRGELGLIDAQVFRGDSATLARVERAIMTGALLNRCEQPWYGFEMPPAYPRHRVLSG